METEEPTRQIPKRETADPRLEQLRIDNEDPRCKKSKTDIEEPHRPIPKNETDDPMRAKLRIDNEEPK